MDHPIRIKFHGVRAIQPVPSKENQTTGGNTSCIEIIDGHSLLFINAGYGLASAGDKLDAELKVTQTHAEITILMSDFLWDSTLGLPSFSPIHESSSQIRILTGNSPGVALAGLNDVTSNIFSPFNGFHSLAAKKEILQVTSGIKTGHWTVAAKVSPNALTTEGSTIWRIKHDRGDDIGVVLLCEKNETTIAEVSCFLEGCETLICAATCHPDPIAKDENRIGFSEALTIALASKTKCLILSQYHPAMNDLDIQAELLALHESMDRFKQKGIATDLTIRLATELESISVSDVGIVKIAI
jgi:predicted oxidoreductase